MERKEGAEVDIELPILALQPIFAFHILALPCIYYQAYTLHGNGFLHWPASLIPT